MSKLCVNIIFELESEVQTTNFISKNRFAKKQTCSLGGVAVPMPLSALSLSNPDESKRIEKQFNFFYIRIFI